MEDEREWSAGAGQFGLSDYLPPQLIARLRAGEVVVYERHSATQRRLPGYGASPVLLAPLRLGPDLIGMLALDYGATPHVFTAAEHALVGATAHLVALVLQRDRLFQEREEGRVRELTLQETTQRMDEFLATASRSFGLASGELRNVWLTWSATALATEANWCFASRTRKNCRDWMQRPPPQMCPWRSLAPSSPSPKPTSTG